MTNGSYAAEENPFAEYGMTDSQAAAVIGYYSSVGVVAPAIAAYINPAPATPSVPGVTPGVTTTVIPPPVITNLDINVSALLQPIKDLFNSIWGNIQVWFNDVKNWIVDHLSPLITAVYSLLSQWFNWLWNNISPVFDNLYQWIQGIIEPITSFVDSSVGEAWYWIQAAVDNIINQLRPFFDMVWDWVDTGFDDLKAFIQSLLNDVSQKVSDINHWFSDEFIDPFIDWLVQLPGKLWEPFNTQITAIGHSIETWLTHKSPGFMAVFSTWWAAISAWWKRTNAGIHAWDRSVNNWFLTYETKYGGLAQALIIILSGGLAASALTSSASIGAWFVRVFSLFGGWLASMLPRLGGWFASQWVPLLGSSAILGAAATGQLQSMIDKFVSPAINGVMTWAESMGPVAPDNGANVITGITKLATFTVSGLAAMTLAGEALSPLKHIGLGHIAAVLYDLINYKTLTAAFMGVLAVCYIKTPLTYYYNKVARPNIPNERELAQMLSQQDITPAQYREYMPYHGWPNEWIERNVDSVYRALSPFIIGPIAQQVDLAPELIDYWVRLAGYGPQFGPLIKKWIDSEKAAGVKALSTTIAISRFKEGFDTEDQFRQNMVGLGIDAGQLSRYVFAANLNYLYDYQTDLKAYYIDLYHRRAIEEPELRSDLVQTGLAPDRLDLVVSQQKIKRLAAAKEAEDPAIAVEFDTIRDRRKKLLISRDDEVKQLVAIGKELPYALAIADNDDVALAEKAVPPKVVVVLDYETEAGKVQVDTIRRLRRGGQTTAEQETISLSALQMPDDLAQAIVDNDGLRIKAGAAGGA